MNAQHGPAEQERLQALLRYGILDTEPEPAFDSITTLAAHICGTPIALITLVDGDRAWVKSQFGAQVSNIDRPASLTARTVFRRQFYAIPDTWAADDEVKASIAVTKYATRFYAGMPLITPDGHAIGAICVLDSEPRELTEEQVEALRTLAQQAMDQLELRRHTAELAHSNARLEREVAQRRRAEAKQRLMTLRLRNALAVADELVASPDADTLCRRAVELMRTKLRLERVAIFLEDGQHMRGTYGTNRRGQTTDERHASIPREDCRRYTDSFVPGGPRWAAFEDDHIEFQEGTPVPVSCGWIAATPIKAGDKMIGVIYNDAAVTGAPLDEAKQDVVALFGSVLGAALRQKEAEDARRRSEQRLRTLVEHGSDVITTIDPQGVFTFVTSSIERLLGYSVEECTGKSALELIHADDIPRVMPLFERRLREPGVGEPIAFRFRARDGSWRHMEAIGTNPGLEAGVDGLIVVARDVTARVEAEQQLAQAFEELRRSNAELEQFAYVASHDLQEPLRMVQSYLDLLQRRYSQHLDERANEFIGFAVDGAQRMRQLVNDLLAISRVGTKGSPPAPADSREVLDTVLGDLEGRLREAGAEVFCGELPTVIADGVQLAQVFQNLVSNALKFRSGRACRIHVGAERHNGAWVFSVRDNGIGIDPRHRDRIFVLFQRLHSRAEYPGTGIGLALCKKIVERHGGRIWVESTPGEGSTFYFTLPMSPLPA